MSRKLLTCLFGLLAVCSTQGWWFFDKFGNLDETKCFWKAEETCGALTEFYLYTRELRDNPISLTQDGDTNQLILDHVKRDTYTKFISHGFHGKCNDDWVKNMARRIVDTDDVNVIAVNWEQSADNLNYFQAAANTRAVGERVAAMILQISDRTRNDFSSFHLIGQSLGAHVSGFAGKAVKRLRKKKIGRISGLDPAGPCFRKSDPANRLCPRDAAYVDVIHTDADGLFQLGFGTETLMGTIDFFPNGGENQPGCPQNLWDSVKTLISKTEVPNGVFCSHSRANKLFHESINPDNTFLTCPCPNHKSFNDTACMMCSADDSERMGYYSTPPKSVKLGYVYTTQTTETSPFYNYEAVTVY